MLKNYFKTAWRSLLKNKLSACINIGGLSAGMAVAMLIACWIYNEYAFDRQFANHRRIAQVWEIWPNRKGIQKQIPAIVADELRAKFGNNFKRIVLSSQTQEHVLSIGQTKLIKSRLLHTTRRPGNAHITHARGQYFRAQRSILDLIIRIAG